MNFPRLRNKHHALTIKGKEKLHQKSWYFFKWEMMVILGVAFLTAILNEIPIWAKDSSQTDWQQYPLRNNIAYSSFVVLVTIGLSIFIGVFTEMGKYTGRYGSAIFILVPLFVWLLSEHGEGKEGMTNVLETATFVDSLMFWSIVAMAILFVIVTAIHELLIWKIVSPSRHGRLEFYYNYFNRLMLLIVNILMVLIMSYALINYALFSLHLGDVTPSEKKIMIENGTPASEIYPFVFHNDRIVIFHSVITVGFSILMILIGLVSTFRERTTVMVIAEEASKIEGAITTQEAERENDLDDEELFREDDDDEEIIDKRRKKDEGE